MNMDLYFAGTLHYDPLGRVNLRQWLEHLKQTHDQEPSFIAVESIETIHKNIDAHRKEFKMFVEPHLPGNVLNDIVLSLGYEGDCHQELFSNSPTTWLNNNIKDLMSKDIIGDYAYNSYIRICDVFLNDNCRAYLCDLNKISLIAWNYDITALLQEGPTAKYEKYDARWAPLIIKEIGQHKDGWAIVIVGAQHTLDIEGSILHRLKSNPDVNIAEVKVLCPESLLSSYEEAAEKCKNRNIHN